MQIDVELDILSHFTSVPHEGLKRVIHTLDVIGIPTVARKWRSKGDENFPRIELMLDADEGYQMGMGVTRQPFRGHTSWISLHRQNDRFEPSTVLRLCYSETEKRWSREWGRGVIRDQRIDELVGFWFPKNEASVPLTQDGHIDATLQHFASLLLDG